MSTSPELRIGDAERESAVSALGEHFASGRLTHEEYDERSARAWAAKTNSDLSPLFNDLPSLGRGGLPGETRNPGTAVGRDHLSTGAARPRDGRFRIPWVPLILLVLGLSFLLPGPWWLLLIGAFVISKSFRHGCHGHPRRR